jgi:hypothetical protein
VLIWPAQPHQGDGLSMQIIPEQDDADRDEVTFVPRWYQNGRSVAFDRRVPPSATRPGDVWRLEVTPDDGTHKGPKVVAKTTILPPINQDRAQAATSALVPPAAKLGPAGATVTTGLTCELPSPPSSNLHYRTAWYHDGVRVPLPFEQTHLSGEYLRTGQLWSCAVEVTDGTQVSTRLRSNRVRIRNSPPSQPMASITPAQPNVGANIECRIAALANDPDGDPLQYSFAWRLDGRPFPSTANRIRGSYLMRGQIWTCEIRAHDATSAGPVASASVEVGNSIPTPPSVRVVPAEPLETQPLTCEVTRAAHDADKDEVRYVYQWMRDGVLYGAPTNSPELSGRYVFNKDFWQCIATPTDGIDKGMSGESSHVLVQTDAIE